MGRKKQSRLVIQWGRDHSKYKKQEGENEGKSGGGDKEEEDISAEWSWWKIKLPS